MARDYGIDGTMVDMYDIELTVDGGSREARLLPEGRTQVTAPRVDIHAMAVLSGQPEITSQFLVRG